MTCPKCHTLMFGPTWHAPTNSLAYRCGCGFEASRPANDAKVSSAKDLAAILTRLGGEGRQ